MAGHRPFSELRAEVVARYPRVLAYLAGAEKEDKMCIFCKYGAEKFKLRRRWVHHFPDTGRIIVCEDMVLKPQSP